MKVVSSNALVSGMRLGQNIYRNDGFLALPKGVMLKRREIDTIHYHQLEYVVVLEKHETFGLKEDDIAAALSILEGAYLSCTLWEKTFGEQLYKMVSKRITKNRKIKKYVNRLRSLDSYSYAHCINVSMLVAALLKMEHRVDEHLGDLIFLTLLHDIGRIKMDDLFNKEGKLDEHEFSQLTKHPITSFNLLKVTGFSKHELKFVMETHEKWDGTGYPHRLQGEEIEELAQLINIADIYNGLSSYRPYRGVYAPYDVLNIIRNEQGKTFGERYIRFFLERFTPYPIGTRVELTNGEIGVVKFVKENQKVLPIVEVLMDELLDTTKLVDLSLKKELRVRRVLQTY